MNGQARQAAPTTSSERSAHRGRELGAGLVEYALLVALIALACVASLQMFGVNNGGSINNTASTYGDAVN